MKFEIIKSVGALVLHSALVSFFTYRGVTSSDLYDMLFYGILTGIYTFWAGATVARLLHDIALFVNAKRKGRNGTNL